MQIISGKNGCNNFSLKSMMLPPESVCLFTPTSKQVQHPEKFKKYALYHPCFPFERTTFKWNDDEAKEAQRGTEVQMTERRRKGGGHYWDFWQVRESLGEGSWEFKKYCIVQTHYRLHPQLQIEILYRAFCLRKGYFTTNTSHQDKTNLLMWDSTYQKDEWEAKKG